MHPSMDRGPRSARCTGPEPRNGVSRKSPEPWVLGNDPPGQKRKEHENKNVKTAKTGQNHKISGGFERCARTCNILNLRSMCKMNATNCFRERWVTPAPRCDLSGGRRTCRCIFSAGAPMDALRCAQDGQSGHVGIVHRIESLRFVRRISGDRTIRSSTRSHSSAAHGPPHPRSRSSIRQAENP